MIVIDASIAVKWLNKKEEGSDIALSLYKKHIEGEEKIFFPQLLCIEVANYLATKTNTLQHDITESLHILFQSNFEIYQSTEEELIETTILAKQYNTSVYDMLYAVIAKRNNCNLITADEKFAQKVNFTSVKILAKIPFH